MRLAHLFLTVTDQDRSRRFYETGFGFEWAFEAATVREMETPIGVRHTVRNHTANPDA